MQEERFKDEGSLSNLRLDCDVTLQMSAKAKKINKQKSPKKSPFSDILYLTNKNWKGFEPTTVYKWLSRDFEVGENGKKRIYSIFFVSNMELES